MLWYGACVLAVCDWVVVDVVVGALCITAVPVPKGFVEVLKAPIDAPAKEN